MTEPVFVVDWDGTITTDEWPAWGNWMPGAIEALKELLKRGRVKVYSSRLSPYQYGFDGTRLRESWEVVADISEMRRRLDDVGLEAVEIHTAAGKPGGTYYIDNQAIEFKGDWDSVLSRVCWWESETGQAKPVTRQEMSEVIREFASGATRDTSEGKLAYEGFFSPIVLEERARYMHRHRVQSDGNLRAPDNWQKGMPLEAYIDSGWRHFMDWWLNHRGYASRESIKEALCGLMFNCEGYLHELLKDEA